MTFGPIWDAFWEPLGWFFGPKMPQTIMFFLSAFCMLSGSRAGWLVGWLAGWLGGARAEITRGGGGNTSGLGPWGRTIGGGAKH